MRKSTLLLCFILLTPFFVKAGSIEIVSIDSVLIVSPYISEAKAKCIFKNTSTVTKSFSLRVVATKIDEGIDLSFCWGPICYPPLSENEPFEPLDLITLAPGEISGQNEFYFTFVPNGYIGEAIAIAVIFDNSNPTDSLLLTFRFVSQTLGVEYSENIFNSNAIIIEDIKELENFGFDLLKTVIFNISGIIIGNNFKSLQNQNYLFSTGVYLAQQGDRKRLFLLR